jgi:hypothetical protein
MILTLVSITIVVYFAVLTGIPIITSKGADTNTFFTANRQSSWYLAAFGMIGVLMPHLIAFRQPMGNRMSAIFKCIHPESSSY